MKQNCPQSYSSLRQPFLQKFAGKLNTISKHGEITDQKGFKLPLISTFSSKRSNTVLMKNTSQSKQSVSSQGIRIIPSNSGIQSPGLSNHFMKSKSKVFTDMSNNFIKSRQKANHPKSSSAQSVFGLLIGTSESRILVSERHKIKQLQNGLFDRQRFSQHGQGKMEQEEVKKTARTKRYFI